MVVKQTAEQPVSANLAQRPVRAVLVVVLNVDAKELRQMPLTHDQQPVQAIGFSTLLHADRPGNFCPDGRARPAETIVLTAVPGGLLIRMRCRWSGAMELS